jgi:hypothetical protein
MPLPMRQARYNSIEPVLKNEIPVHRRSEKVWQTER